MDFLQLNKRHLDTGPIVLYHKDCIDGFGAAYAIWSRYPNCEFVALDYNDEVPNVMGRLVFMVDFSMKFEKMKQLIEDADYLIWLDHHPQAFSVRTALSLDPELDGRWHAQLDADTSGAMLAWRFMWPDRSPPPLMEAIADYDTWQFKLPNTEANVAVLCSYEYSFSVWNQLMLASRNVDSWLTYKISGYSLLRQQQKNARETIAQQKGVFAVFNDQPVPVVNCPRHLTGAVSKILLKDHPMCGIFYHTAKGRKWSLRSNKEIDVNEIAKSLGGGGHQQAAAFTQRTQDCVGIFWTL